MAKNMSQNDVRRITGLFACYISRLENGFTMPSLATLETLARGFQIPFHEFLYQLTAPRFGDVPDEQIAIEMPEQTTFQADLQTAGQTPEMLETHNNVRSELTCSEKSEHPAA